MAQPRISRTLRDEAEVSRIAAILSQETFDSRRALGRRICAEFSFVDATGRLQIAGCMKALATLANTEPCIVLPPPRSPAVNYRPRQLDADVPEPVGVLPHLAGIADLAIQVVTTSPDRALWNTLIARKHPHGMTTFAVCQVRYLVGSSHGWLGAAGFCSAALRVSARDRWIGWDDAGRRDHLHRVTCLSRVLRPLPGPQARSGTREPDHVAWPDPALERRTGPSHRIPRRPEARIAPGQMTCCNANLS